MTPSTPCLTRRGSWQAALPRDRGTSAPRFVRPPKDPWSSSKLTSIPRSAGSRCARTIDGSLGSSTALPEVSGVLSTSPSRSEQARAGWNLRPRPPARPPQSTPHTHAAHARTHTHIHIRTHTCTGYAQDLTNATAGNH